MRAQNFWRNFLSLAIHGNRPRALVGSNLAVSGWLPVGHPNTNLALANKRFVANECFVRRLGASNYGKIA
jgi:hypothetical protein